MDGQPIMEIERSRSTTELIGATFELYRRHSWLFLILAGVVVVPYSALSLLGEPGSPIDGALRVIIEQVVLIADLALVLPLVSALHVYAVEDVRQGREPDLGSVARRGIASLRVVSPAVFLSLLGIILGTVALIVPGIILAIRWAVVAQAGALGAPSWRKALDQSAGLTERNGMHVFGLLALLLLITSIPFGIRLAVFGRATTVGSFIVSTGISVIVTSFAALAIAFLYFDLKARFRADLARGSAPSAPPSSSGRVVPPTGHPLDPASWTDEDRPAGWYIDPVEPIRMRYWPAGPQPQWSKRRARTPNATWEEWSAHRKQAKAEGLPEEPV